MFPNLRVLSENQKGASSIELRIYRHLLLVVCRPAVSVSFSGRTGCPTPQRPATSLLCNYE